MSWGVEYGQLVQRVQRHGVVVRSEACAENVLGSFDGVSITTRCDLDIATRCHVVAHCFGHTVQWALDFSGHAHLYHELGAAKRGTDKVDLVDVLERFRRYEEVASEYGAALFAPDSPYLSEFANFSRADIEFIIAYHRGDRVPGWSSFFAKWNQEVAQGVRAVEPFLRRSIPDFTPRHVPERKVITT